MAATYQRVSGGRLLLNVVTGGDKTEQERFGDFLEKADRYRRTGEFLSVVRGAWGDEGFDLDGEHIQVRGAIVPDAPQPPGIYFGGSSPEALEVAAEHADVYLTWGEPPEQVAEKLGRVRELADARGRALRYGIRLHVIARDTAEEAWAEAGRLLDAMDPASVRRAQENLRSSESEGQRRMLELHGGRRDSLVVAPNLWAGIGLVRGGAGTALVGSHEEVADRIAEYHEAGIDEFIFSGYPHLEEAYRFGEGVFPVLRDRGLLADRAQEAVPAAV
jgi:alkanesulfonate monooxygenase